MLVDDETIQGCLKNERKAQEVIFKKYYGILLVMARRYSVETLEPQDLVQDIFIKVFQKLNQYKVGTCFDAWIKRLAKNHCLDVIRRKKYFKPLDDSINQIATFDKVFDIAIEPKKINVEQLLQFIEKLTTNQRIVFNMFVVDGYSHAEICEELGIEINTSKSLLFRAKNSLKEKINEIITNSNETVRGIIQDSITA